MTDKPYKFCEAHFKRDCSLCETPSGFPPPVKEGAAPVPEKVATASVPDTPIVSDPVQQKMIDAAKQYADSIQAMAVIADQVKRTRELLDALEKKLAETKKLAQEARKLTEDALK